MPTLAFSCSHHRTIFCLQISPSKTITPEFGLTARQTMIFTKIELSTTSFGAFFLRTEALLRRYITTISATMKMQDLMVQAIMHGILDKSAVRISWEDRI